MGTLVVEGKPPTPSNHETFQGLEEKSGACRVLHKVASQVGMRCRSSDPVCFHLAIHPTSSPLFAANTVVLDPTVPQTPPLPFGSI